MSDYNEISTRDIMKEDFGWEVPVESVPVPSDGRVYPEGSSLSGRKTIDIRAMTAREEDILSSRPLIQQGKVVTYLLQSCIIDKSVDVRDMLLGDRTALMVAVRVTGYGANYSCDATCPECGARSTQEFNLGELEIKRLGIDPVSPGENLFSFTLPVTKKKVNFRFLTGRDEEERAIVEERRKKLMPDREVESQVTSKLEQNIVSVDGVEDKNKLNVFIKNMPALDSRKLRKYIAETEPGVKMKSWMKCPKCSESSLVDLPLGINFFWPSE